jgi:hypothetical protein
MTSQKYDVINPVRKLCRVAEEIHKLVFLAKVTVSYLNKIFVKMFMYIEVNFK